MVNTDCQDSAMLRKRGYSGRMVTNRSCPFLRTRSSILSFALIFEAIFLYSSSDSIVLLIYLKNDIAGPDPGLKKPAARIDLHDNHALFVFLKTESCSRGLA